jgi:hypothetical protein
MSEQPTETLVVCLETQDDEITLHSVVGWSVKGDCLWIKCADGGRTMFAMRNVLEVSSTPEAES